MYKTNPIVRGGASITSRGVGIRGKKVPCGALHTRLRGYDEGRAGARYAGMTRGERVCPCGALDSRLRGYDEGSEGNDRGNLVLFILKKTRGRQKANPKFNCVTRYILFSAFNIFKGFGIYNNLFTLFDKQRNLNANTVVQNCRFTTTAGNCLTFQGRFCFFDCGNNCLW